MRYVLMFVLALLLAPVVVLLLRDTPNLELADSPGFPASGISPVQYNGYRKQSLYLSMPDSTRLAVDIFLPGTGEGKERFPVIFEYTPYNRANVVTGLPLWKRVLARWRSGSWGPVFDGAAKRISRQLIARGYAYVIADMRGTGASFGVHVPLEPQLARDGKVIVEWIADQPWCNGKIGMIGQSYHGWSQFAVAAQKPRGLTCIAPALIMAETYSEANRPGGIAATSWLHLYSDFLEDLNHNVSEPTRPLPVTPAAPVVDEDGDGAVADEIPTYERNDPRRFTEDGAPQYADGVKRRNHWYYQATKGHLQNLRPDFFLREPYRYYNDTLASLHDTSLNWSDTSPGAMIPAIRESGVAVLNIGGWFDGFAKGAPFFFQNLPNSHLLIAPRFHQPASDLVPAYAAYLGYQGNWMNQQFLYTLRFFDYHLKGRKNGWDKEPPAYLYTINKGWQHAQTWPPSGEDALNLYFQPGRKLNAAPAPTGRDAYSVDFSHASDYGEPQLNRWVMVKPSRELMNRTHLDSLCYWYETPPLEEALEVTGHPIAHIMLSADQPDADIFVYLCDVSPDGRALYVSEGQLRAGWYPLAPASTRFADTTLVHNGLPWHDYRRGKYVQRPLADGKVIPMRLDLFPVSWVFKKGHRLRVAVAGADAGNFEMNPALCPDGKNCPPTTFYFHRDGNNGSRLELPIAKQ